MTPSLGFTAALLVALLIWTVSCNDSKSSTVKGKNANVCTTSACKDVARTLSKNMDTSVDPCNDFYAYACGRYQKSATAKAGDSAVKAKEMAVRAKLVGLLTKPGDESASGATAKAKRLFKACTGNVERNAATGGRDAVSALLAKLHGWPLLEGDSWEEKRIDWKEMSYRLMQYGMYDDYLIRVDTVADLNNTLYMVEVGMPDFGAVLAEKESDDSAEIVSIARFLDPASARSQTTRIAREAEKILAFKKKLQTLNPQLSDEADTTANTTTTLTNEEEKKREVKADDEDDDEEVEAAVSNYMSIFTSGGDDSAKEEDEEQEDVGDLQKQAGFVHWLEYLKHWLPEGTAIKESDPASLPDMPYLVNLGKLLNATDQRTVVNYLVWTALRKQVLPYVSNATRSIVAKKDATKTDTVRDANEVCTDDMLFKKMKLATVALYARHHVTSESERGVAKLFHGDVQSLLGLLRTQQDIDEKTRQAAIDKVQKIRYSADRYYQMTHSPRLVDDYYKEAEVQEDDYLSSVLSLNALARRRKGERLNQRLSLFNWITDIDGLPSNTISCIINAYYIPLNNALTVGPGFYEDPFLLAWGPQYLNHGVLAYVMGHELTHSLDTISILVNGKGVIEQWWTKASLKSYEQRAHCISRQYSNITIKGLDYKVKGAETLNENLADSTGLTLAYQAYLRYTKEHGEDPALRIDQDEDDEKEEEEGRTTTLTPNQAFWLTFASFWCATDTAKTLHDTYDSDIHSPPEFRVTGSIMNQEGFATDFNCPEGSRMNPVKKCHLF